MIIVDTNILTLPAIESFVELSNIEHDYLAVFASISYEEIVIPDFIITELTILIQKKIPAKYKFSKAESLSLLKLSTLLIEQKYLLKANYTTPSKDEFFLSIKEYQSLLNNDAIRNYLSVQDILIVILAKIRGYTILSLDKQLVQYAKSKNISVIEL